eukprot:TRINITY_DN21818_c0_g1_i1.p1 TRINITY_DN21818_c0_g1~~TRINITY_DN21818_c0_g1_i1.p1  ORF type:complete len:160 (-),score=20.62 TRINITY_DN21818_c0_g1_i1:74-553(-)
MKDREEDDDDNFSMTTPGGSMEGSSLQFSGLDLNKGMIEIKNIGESNIKLHGYALSNQSGTMQFPLPTSMELDSRETLRIYIGEELYKEICSAQNDENEINRQIVGEYNGAYVFWGRDVWTGNDKDCARLYNPAQEEIARIEISPDMVDKAAKKGCLMM